MNRLWLLRAWLTLSLCLVAVPILADPCTLYKPRNIAIARANIERYDWAKQLLRSYQKSAKSLLAMDREAFRQIVPDLTPWSTYGQVCPQCVNEKCSMGETGVWTWRINKPDVIRCKYCQTEYPNPKYPETGRLDCPRMGQSFTYYLNDEQRAHPDEDPGKYAYRWAGRPVQVSFSGVIRAMKVHWALAQPLPLARLYALTGEAKYAQRTAWILERLAEVYTKYLYHSYGGCFADLPQAEVAREMGLHPTAGKFPRGVICHPAKSMRERGKDGSGGLDAGFWGAGRFTTGAGGEGGALLHIVVAYDLTHEACYPDGLPVYSPQMKRLITEDLILAGCADMEHYKAINNKCGPGRALSGAVGLLFRQPERVHRALEGLQSLLDECFHFDGFCKESPAYSSMHLGLMGEIPDLLCGYSDPAGYVPAAGPRLEDFDPYQQLTRYRLALESMVRMLCPDRKYPVIGDTQAGSGIGTEFVEILADHYGSRYARLLETVQRAPLAKKGSTYALWNRDPDLRAEAEPAGSDAGLPLRSEYFPGWQVGVLRSGNDSSQTAFYFNGYAAHGHRHYDTLGIIYHAFNQELASDRGYIWDDPRNAWTKSTLAHNLVTVDGKSQDVKARKSQLELFAVTPGVEVIQASADAYRDCPEYRRTCALVRLPEGGNYMVDFFRVQGGKQHQYGMNCNGKLLGLENVTLAPAQEEVQWLSNLRAADKLPATLNATWEHAGVRFRMSLLTPIDRLLVADAPGWRSYRGDQLHAPPITQLLAERRGAATLASRYAAVLCPYQGETPPLGAMRLLTASPASDQVLAVAVQRDGCTDYVISALDDQPHSFGPVRLQGRFGFATLDAQGRLLRALLLEGTELTCGDQRLRAPLARASQNVLRSEGQRAVLAQALPASLTTPGAYVRSARTAFEIQSVEGSALSVREFPFEGGEEVTATSQVWFERSPQ